MQRFFILFFLSCLCCTNGLSAQKLLRLETVKNPKKLVYYIGSPITFRLEDDGGNSANMPRLSMCLSHQA